MASPTGTTRNNNTEFQEFLASALPNGASTGVTAEGKPGPGLGLMAYLCQGYGPFVANFVEVHDKGLHRRIDLAVKSRCTPGAPQRGHRVHWSGPGRIQDSPPIPRPPAGLRSVASCPMRYIRHGDAGRPTPQRRPADGTATGRHWA